MNQINQVFFAPELFIKNGVYDVSFYQKAFGAVELRKFLNNDGSYHVSELSIEGAVFHLHETVKTSEFEPERYNGTTVVIGLFVPDVHAFMNKALAAGAVEVSPVQDYDYGYRQGSIRDPFGHQWQIQMKI